MKLKGPSLSKKSTRAFFDEAKGIPNFSLFETLHGYVYLRWPYLYIGVAKGYHPLSKVLAPLWKAISWAKLQKDNEDPDRVTFADTYHGKVVPLEAASQLVHTR